MLAFLLIWATEHFLDAARHLGREEDASHYGRRMEDLKRVCQARLWDGDWFLRGFTADGRPIGSHTAREGKVHLESNAWAVVSGAATRYMLGIRPGFGGLTVDPCIPADWDGRSRAFPRLPAVRTAFAW